MNVTREVVGDLLPAYLYGEVSADTRALVREFLEQNPEYARSVVPRTTDDSEDAELLKGAAEMTLSPDHELRTLNRTRSMLERRRWLFALALTFSFVPISFTFDNSHITWMMVRDVPRMAAVYWAVSLGFWVALGLTNRRLRASGL
jgi:anti-sigma factor RsiW